MWDFKLKTFLHDLKDQMEKPLVLRKSCDIAGCPHLGDFKAPKSPHNLTEYHWFCLDHVREYNQNWDFFKGMSQGEIEHHMHKTMMWDRPTWRMTESGLKEGRTREKIHAHFTSGENIFGNFSMGGDETGEDAHINIQSIPHPAVEALAVMDLAPPVDWDEVKARYKILAKKYHPDTNKNDPAAEELLKKINLAYSILKISYQNYTKLEDRK